MKSICSPSSCIVYQATLCTYLLRHAIFNEQSDLDRGDIISHDLVQLDMLLVSSIKEIINREREFFFSKNNSLHHIENCYHAMQTILIRNEAVKRNSIFTSRKSHIYVKINFHIIPFEKNANFISLRDLNRLTFHFPPDG